MFFIVLKRSLLAVLFFAFCFVPVAQALGNPSTAVSASSGSVVERDDASLLAAALHLRETKPALFDGVLGVLIVNVLPDSQAAEKGLRPGDIVITC